MSEECGSEVNAVGYYSFSGFDTKTPFLIGVAGGTASGKTSVCRKIMSRVGQEGQVVCIHQDNFYKGLSPFERDRANRGLFNYDHPVLNTRRRTPKVNPDSSRPLRTSTVSSEGLPFPA